MKKLNLLLIPLIFSSLLIGCGIKGPLYRAPETQTIEKPQTTETQIEEESKKVVEDEVNAS